MGTDAINLPACTLSEFHTLSQNNPADCPCGYAHRDNELIDTASALLGKAADTGEFRMQILNAIKDHMTAAMVMAAYAAANKTLTVDVEEYTHICREVYRVAQRQMVFGSTPEGRPF